MNLVIWHGYKICLCYISQHCDTYCWMQYKFFVLALVPNLIVSTARAKFLFQLLNTHTKKMLQYLFSWRPSASLFICFTWYFHCHILIMFRLTLSLQRVLINYAASGRFCCPVHVFIWPFFIVFFPHFTFLHWTMLSCCCSVRTDSLSPVLLSTLSEGNCPDMTRCSPCSALFSSL